MQKLEDVLETFRNDKNWNTEYQNGTHRFDREIEWIGKMVNSYADFFHVSADEVITRMEEDRTYSWPNYYQPANFPDVSTFGEVGVFQTFKDFQDYKEQHWAGFRCPVCGTIGDHPQECMHRIKKDGKCDWCSYGFLQTSKKIIILENGFKAIPIFEPILKEEVNDGLHRTYEGTKRRK